MKLRHRVGQGVSYENLKGVVSSIDYKKKTFFADFKIFSENLKTITIEFYWDGTHALGGLNQDWEKCR